MLQYTSLCGYCTLWSLSSASIVLIECLHGEWGRIAGAIPEQTAAAVRINWRSDQSARAARAARAGQLTNCLIKTPVCFCPGWGGCCGQRIVFICLCCRRTWHLTTPSSEWPELGTLLHCYIKVSRWPRKISQLLLLGPFLLFESSYSKDP